MTKALSSRIGMVYLFTFLAIPFTLALRIFYARTLSVEAYGVFYAILSLLVLLGLFNDLGLSQSLVHHLAKYIQAKSARKVKSSILFVLLVEVATSLILALVLVLFAKPIALTLFKSTLAISVLPIFAFVFFLQNLFDLVKHIFEGFGKENLYSSMNPVRLFFVLLSSLIGYWLFDSTLLVLFSLIWVASFLFVLLLYIPALRKLFRFFLEGAHHESDGTPVRRVLFRYGVFVLSTSLAQVFLGRTDTLLLSAFNGPTDVALYEVALPLVSFITLFTSPLASFLFPHVSELTHRKDYDGLKVILSRVYSTGLYLFLPVATILFFTGPYLIALLFGDRYLGAVAALRILVFGFVFKGLFGINAAIIDGLGHVKDKMKFVYAGFALNLVLDLILIPLIGISGAAISTSISFCFMFGATYFHLKKFISLPFDVGYFGKVLFANILLALCLLAFSFISSLGLLFVICFILLLLVVYLQLGHALRLFTFSALGASVRQFLGLKRR